MEVLDRLLALLLGLVLLALGVLATVEATAAVLGAGPVLPLQPALDALAETTWSSPVVLAVSAAVAAVGLVLLLAELRRRRPRVFLLEERTEHVSAGVERDGLRAGLESVAASLPGVAGARARIGRRRVSLKADTPLRGERGLDERVEREARDWFDGLGLRSPQRLSVSVHRRKG